MTDTYPKVFEHIIDRINSEWEPTIALMEEGMRQGKIRKINIPVFKLMVEASIKDFISSEELEKSNISYEQALEEMIDILVKGMIP